MGRRLKLLTPRDVEEIRTQYQNNLVKYNTLMGESVFVIESALKEDSIKYHSVTSRIKEPSSLLKKAARLKCAKPLEEIHEIVGARIVCLFLSDVEVIGRLLRETLEIVSEDNKIDEGVESTFGYMSHHFIAKIPNKYSGPRYDPIVGMKFEIQVRTIAMEAWATASHYLDYKTEIDIPKDLRRDFFALSGLFYVADKHFEMFFRARERSRESVVSGDPEHSDEINLDTLTAYLERSFPKREQPEKPSDVSTLVGELVHAGVRTLGQLDGIRKKHWNAFLKDEATNPPVDKETGSTCQYAAEGVVRGVLYSEYPDLARKMYPHVYSTNKK